VLDIDKQLLDHLYAGAKRLAGKVCIVTGAGQGIGRATAKRLGAEGGKIVVVDRIEKTSLETVELLTRHGVEAYSACLDISTPSGARALMMVAIENCGRVDVLVNNVGGTIWWQPYSDYTDEQVELELQRSLYSTLWCCRAVLPLFIAQRAGVIVNVSSSAGSHGAPYRAPYSASKGGVDALTKTLALENGKYGIRVNALAPGVTVVPDRVTSRLVIEPGQEAAASANTEMLQKETRDQGLGPLGRHGTVEEQAAVIAFLASEDSGFITGQVISCTGNPN